MNIDKNSFVTIDYLINLGEAETYPPDGKAEEISFCMGGGRCLRVWKKPCWG